MTRLSLLVLALGFMVVGCCSCPPPPHKDEKQPRHLTENLLHFVKEECYGEAFDRSSVRTREEQSRWGFKFVAGSATLEDVFPAIPCKLKLRQILLAGSHLGYLPYDLDAPEGTPPTELWWLFEDKLEPEADRPHMFRFLLVKELDDGDRVWRFGMQEMIDRNLSPSAE